MVSLKRDEAKCSPWLFFFLLTTSNSLLSFSHFSSLTKGWILVVGIIFPLCGWFFVRNPKPEEFKMDFFGNPKSASPYLAICLLFFFSILFRSHFYLSANRWPNGDEALNGFLAVDLTQKWRWDFFYTCGQLPPLLTWGLSFLFKHSYSCRWSLWLIPLMVSSLTVFVAYWAFRPLLKEGFSLLFACFMAFSFWPVYEEGFCHQGIFIPLWENSLFFVFGFYLRHPRKEKRNWLALILGLATGLGSFTFTSWPVVAFGIILAFLFVPEGPPAGIREKLFFLAGFFLALAPFCLAVLKSGYGAHILGSSSLTQWYGLDHQWVTKADYLSTIFWGPLQGGTSYGPVRGGMINPLLGSFFWMGTTEVLRRKKIRFWIFLSFFLALLPGFLSADYVEMFRIIQVMPLVLFVAVIGFQSFLGLVPEKKKAVILGSLLLTSLAFDFRHLDLAFSTFEPGKTRQTPGISPDENFNAFQILKKTSQQRGPGLIFTDFLTLSHGHALGVTTYPFNVLSNPKLVHVSANWAGIVTDTGYLPFLSSEVPGVDWYWAGTKPDSMDGLMVGIITLNDRNRATFNYWAKADQFFHQLSVESENDFYSKTAYRQSLQELNSGYSLVERDRFLESCYGDWVAQYFFSPTYSENIAAIKRAVQRGYPACHLYQELSDLLAGQGRALEAEQAHQEALAHRPNFKVGGDGSIIQPVKIPVHPMGQN